MPPTRPLWVTTHATERWVKRWRPDVSFHDAQRELLALAARATATRDRSVKDDARVYVAVTDAGESVKMLVRDGAVVTVLPKLAAEGLRTPEMPDDEMLAESRADRAAARAILRHEADERAREALRNANKSKEEAMEAARTTLERWKSGDLVAEETVDHAMWVLGVISSAEKARRASVRRGEWQPRSTKRT